jgi:hypothetical protein
MFLSIALLTSFASNAVAQIYQQPLNVSELGPLDTCTCHGGSRMIMKISSLSLLLLTLDSGGDKQHSVLLWR